MRSVKDFFEYREYLKEFYEEKKKGNPYFSYRYMGGKVATDASHLVKIFQKQRHISEPSIETFIHFCGLTGSDAEYFSFLVRFNKAKTDRETKQYYEKLLSLKGFKSYTLEKNQYKYYQKWYYSAILTLLDFYTFSGDYKALAAKLSPPITAAQAKEAIELLKNLNLVTENKESRLEQTNKIVTSGELSRSISVRTFQEETLKLAIESLERHAKEMRNISTVTITVSHKDLEEINDMIKGFRAMLLKYAQEIKNPDQVYQLNIQLFPLSL